VARKSHVLVVILRTRLGRIVNYEYPPFEFSVAGLQAHPKQLSSADSISLLRLILAMEFHLAQNQKLIEDQ